MAAVLVALLLAQASREATPQRYQIRVGELAAPYATPSADNGPRVTPRNGAPLYTAPGFRVDAWVTGLNRPRRMAVAPNGDVFVSESYDGRVILLRPQKNGAPAKYTFATGLRQPYGIAFYPSGSSPKFIYIAHTDGVYRYPYRNGDVRVQDDGEKLFDLPGGGYNQHWTRNLIFSLEGRRMYVTVGSASNASPEPSPRASIIEVKPDGTGRSIYGSGLRNPVGLAFHPITGELWTAVNERDNLGNEIVPDYATHVRRGGFYGWPYAYIGNHLDPRLPKRPDLAKKSIVPDVLLEAHCAALGIAFAKGSTFPTPYQNDAFVSMHGSWNRDKRSGYKVVRLTMDSRGNPLGGYQDFVWGWNVNERVWGRPVDVQFDRQGAMLISDDANGTIWRVRPRQGGGRTAVGRHYVIGL